MTKRGILNIRTILARRVYLLGRVMERQANHKYEIPCIFSADVVKASRSIEDDEEKVNLQLYF